MLKVQGCVGLAAAVLGLMGVAMGCGDDEDPPSYGSIAKGLDAPTGTVDATTAAQVGEKYLSANENRVGFGVRDDQVGQSGSTNVQLDCPSGGSYKVSGSGNQSSGTVNIDYDDCCFEAGCCASGDGTMYYNAQNSSAASAYSFCASFDMNYSCRGDTASLEYSGCYGAGGEAILLIEVDGKSFAVSSSRTGASGSLEIRGANGTWTCSSNAGSGTCSSSTGTTFSFTVSTSND
ncbi:MAG: hypothetical protein RL033_1487 [Pseudomonadota bacterium]|jgi:hypothetical protein